ncbi:aspartoacylase [Synechococcus sp. MIT S9509]|uniref:aspartoacylase n=1 Tax=unclassified Synechococcus TaxID=2626047 RepID=UPI0007BC7AA8|nr:MULTISPECIES: aspartoacylase [unclassified Synechococcus]KZR84674.1 aspartoacylase [Synechococcus sp. MIT S9504]KZR89786.1 aspartoacylase [Synechococcus sp. MIT S9509]
MTSPRVLVVAGTHGNEVNAPWLLEQWSSQNELIDSFGCCVQTVIGNPDARAQGRRYLDRDLNRSFRPDLLQRSETQPECSDHEMLRALELLRKFGPEGQRPCDLVVDLHSTTAAMGNCLVVYGRRPADLALAALVQSSLGLQVYLHEADAAQQGFMVERWPCGLVIEVGPVPQGVRRHDIVQQTRLALQAVFEAIADVVSGKASYPRQLLLHRHLKSLDLPRQASGDVAALIHPQLQDRDWIPLLCGDPLFVSAQGTTIAYEGPDGAVPLFINEAAYAEKAIALSLTSREQWPLSQSWTEALAMLLNGNQRGEPL